MEKKILFVESASGFVTKRQIEAIMREDYLQDVVEVGTPLDPDTIEAALVEATNAGYSDVKILREKEFDDYLLEAVIRENYPNLRVELIPLHEANEVETSETAEVQPKSETINDFIIFPANAMPDGTNEILKDFFGKAVNLKKVLASKKRNLIIAITELPTHEGIRWLTKADGLLSFFKIYTSFEQAGLTNFTKLSEIKSFFQANPNSFVYGPSDPDFVKAFQPIMGNHYVFNNPSYSYKMTDAGGSQKTYALCKEIYDDVQNKKKVKIDDSKVKTYLNDKQDVQAKTAFVCSLITSIKSQGEYDKINQDVKTRQKLRSNFLKELDQILGFSEFGKAVASDVGGAAGLAAIKVVGAVAKNLMPKHNELGRTNKKDQMDTGKKAFVSHQKFESLYKMLDDESAFSLDKIGA